MVVRESSGLLRAVYVALICLIASEARAATYYVRKTGNDNNSGTSPAAAWLTLGKAAQTLVAGDTVYVGAGVYTQSFVPLNDGTASTPIRFIADSSGAMTGDAGNVEIGRASCRERV